MAQGSGVAESSTSTASADLVVKTLSQKEQTELQEYEKILQFADTVLKERGLEQDLDKDWSRNGTREATSAHNVPSLSGSANKQPSSLDSQPDKLELDLSSNPTLLKPGQATRDQTQLERERLEQALREEWDRRYETQNVKNNQRESLDISDILARALVLAQPTQQGGSEPDAPANNVTASEDDSYYSSRHDTPEPQLTSRIPNESTIGSPRTGILVPPAAPDESNLARVERSASKAPSDSYEPPPAAVPTPSQASRVPGLNNYPAFVPPVPPSHGNGAFLPSALPQGQRTTSAGMRQMPGTTAAGAPMPSGHPYHHEGIPSPLIRAHNLTPAAPQPTQVPSLAVNTQLADLQRDRSPPVQGSAPSQMAAQRRVSRVGNATSPETSSHSARHQPERNNKKQKAKEKIKDKRKKRKSDRQVPAGDNPFIKTEPRSPSPLTAPAHIRPPKRARHDHPSQPQEPVEEEEAFRRAGPPPPPETVRHAYGSAGREGGPQVVYERTPGYATRSASTALIGDPRYAGEFETHVRSGDHSYYAVRRPAPIIIHEPRPEPPRYYRESREAPRMSVHPGGDYVIQTAPPQPTRIIIDADGREYIEPSLGPIRYSVAPSGPGAPEILYERPARAISRHPGAYEPPASSSYAKPPSPRPAGRRVVTQPEYVSSGYGDMEYADRSSRPIPPRGEPFHAMAPPPERRPIDENNNGGYIMRSASTRPPPEPLRYDQHPEYVRVQSVRPHEPAGQDFMRSIAPQYQTQLPRGYMMDSRQSVERQRQQQQQQQQQYVRREYSTRPAERYYEHTMPGGAEEVAFIGHSYGQNQGGPYANHAEREVYR